MEIPNIVNPGPKRVLLIHWYLVRQWLHTKRQIIKFQWLFKQLYKTIRHMSGFTQMRKMKQKNPRYGLFVVEVINLVVRP